MDYEKELKKALKESKVEEVEASVGKCEISVGSIQHCSNLTESSCYRLASRLNGVATWTANAKC